MTFEREILYGKNVVREVLRAAQRKMYRIFWGRQSKDAASFELQKLIDERKLPWVEASSEKITSITHSDDHQNIAIEVSSFEYASLDFVAQTVKKQKGFLVLFDEIQDPHNVGALIRSGHQFGAGGIVLLKHRQAPITPAVCKAASGAEEYLPIVKEINLVNVIKYLKENGFSIIGASASKGLSLYQIQFSYPLGLVLGSEGRGLRRLVGEHCDQFVHIPTVGAVDSLNVSVAGGILLSKIHEQARLSA